MSGTAGWYYANNFARFFDGEGWSAPVEFSDRDPVRWLRASAVPGEWDPALKHQHYINPPHGASTEECLKYRQSSARADDFVATHTATPFTAPEMLEAAARHIRDRASAYDKPEGERSMAQTVQAFNAITRHALSESEGWLFMELLKAVRDYTTPHGHADSQEDRVAYAALAGEARRAGR